MYPLMMQNMAAQQLGGTPQQSALLQALYGQLQQGPQQMQGSLSGTGTPQFREGLANPPVQRIPNFQPGGLGIQDNQPSPWTGGWEPNTFQPQGSGQQMPNGGPFVPNNLLNRPLR